MSSAQLPDGINLCLATLETLCRSTPQQNFWEGPCPLAMPPHRSFQPPHKELPCWETSCIASQADAPSLVFSEECTQFLKATVKRNEDIAKRTYCLIDMGTLCADVSGNYYFEGPCRHDLFYYPGDACWKNACLDNLAFGDQDIITQAQQLQPLRASVSQICRDFLVEQSLKAQSAYLLAMADGNILRFVSLIASELVMMIMYDAGGSQVILVAALVLLGSTFWLLRKGRNVTQQRKQLHAAILQTIANDENLTRQVEDVTGEKFSPLPFQLHLVNQTLQRENLRRKKNQIQAFRAVYSMPRFKCQVQDKLGSTDMGHVPPLEAADLRHLFQKNKKGNYTFRNILNVGFLFLILFTDLEEIIPFWMYTALVLYFVLSGICMVLSVLLWKRDEKERCSICCQCSRSSAEIAESRSNKKETDEVVVQDNQNGQDLLRCAGCNDTGVCTLHCEDCAKLLDDKFRLLNVDLLLEPDPVEDNQPPRPIPVGTAGRRLF